MINVKIYFIDILGGYTVSLGLSNEDMEMLNAAQDVIEKFASYLPDPSTPVSFCNDCSGSCSGVCSFDCVGSCDGGCRAGCYGGGNC